MSGTDVAAWDFQALALFGAGVAVAACALVLLGGFLPLSARPPERRGPGQTLLLALAGLAVAALAIAALRLAWLALPWTGAVIAAGLGILAGPLLFQGLPRDLRDGPGGLALTAALAGVLAIALYLSGR